MKPFRLAALSVALLTTITLVGCDEKDDKTRSVAPATATASTSTAAAAPAKPDNATLEKLAAQSAGKALTLLDASEIQLDGAAALVLTFSVPLDPSQDFGRTVHVVDKKSGKVDGAWELAPNLKELRLRHLEPNRELLVTVERDLLALNKNTFGSEVEKAITTRDIEPSVGFASRGSLLPGKVVEGLPVMALNVNNVDVNFYRVKPESLAAFVSQWEYRNSLTNWESDNLLKMAELVYTGRFDLNPARNTREKLLLPLADIKPLQQAGVYIAVMNQAGHYNYSNAATLFTLSDIGLSAHRYHNRLDIFTQSLENGATQSAVEVLLLNNKGQTLAQATSNADGHAMLQTDKEAALLLARKEGQTTLLDLTLPAL
ncbi:MAG: alpha-2-macroglobulin family protein, partial [Leclercia adecarboxylata]|nr:alpha-2-macroglobulin family protein [Leclercia adecarboxylata]